MTLLERNGFIGCGSGESDLSTRHTERLAFLALCDRIGREAAVRGLTMKKLAKLLSDE